MKIVKKSQQYYWISSAQLAFMPNEFSSVFWDPYLQKDIDKIERVQKKALHFIMCKYQYRKEGVVTKMLEQLTQSSIVVASDFYVLSVKL